MGKIKVEGGGAQVVRYRTKSGRYSSRLLYNQSEDLEVDDSGDKLWVDMCFLTCGAPSQGPADVLPGDHAIADALLWRGMGLTVLRNGKVIYKQP